MIPVLYGKDEQQFRTYGLGELSEFLETPEVERERNGNYAFYMKYESDGEFADVLEEGMKIKSDAGPRTEWQTFEINRINRDSQGFIEIFANHISMRTKKDAIRPRVSGRGMNGQQLLQLWRNNLVGGEHWDVWSDITTTVSVDWSIEDFDNAREVLGGREGSILDRIGGEYEFDNQTIRLWRSMGRTAPTALEYGRNIKSVVKENQEDNIYTSIYPFATYSLEGSDSVEIFSIPEYFIDSDYIDMYDHRKVQVVDFTTEFDNENPPTPSALRTLAQNYIEANEIGSPWENITVEYQDLSKTLDYADYQIMEEVELNDVVPIEYPKFNIFNNNAKVIVTVYDPVKEEYKRIELGVIRQRLTSALNSGTNGRLSRLERELEQQHVYIMNSRGNRIWYSTPPEDREHNIGDTWFEQNGQYTRLRVWDGNQWIVQIDTEDIDVVSQQVTEALEESRDAKAQVERESEERRADIQAESERLSAEWNERIEKNEAAVQEAKDSADTANQQINDAINDAGFSSLTELTLDLQSISNQAEANALAAIDNALSASTTAESAMTLATDLSGQVSDFELTVDGFNQTVNNYTDQVAQFTSDVNGLNSTVASYETQVGAFGNTVSTYATQVSQFENTVNGLNSTVSSYQSDVQGYQAQVSTLTNTVDGFNATVESVQADYSDLSGSVQSLGASMGVVEGQITNRVWQTDIESAVDGIQVGGRNYLKGTQALDIENFYRARDIEIRQDEDIPYLRSNGTNSDYYIVELEPNATYTLSLDIRNFVSGNSSVLLQWFSPLTSSRNRFEWANIANANITSEWKRFNVTFTVPANDNFFSLGFRMADFRLFKLEKGNKATDWTPAPEDTVELISNVETEWKQTAEGFEQSITRVESDLNGKASLVAFNTLESTVDGTVQRIGDAEGNITQIESTVSGLQTTVASKASQTQVTQLAEGWQVTAQRIDDLSVGGRNLILNSDQDITYTRSVGQGTSPRDVTPVTNRYYATEDGSRVSHGTFFSRKGFDTNTQFTVSAIVEVERADGGEVNPDDFPDNFLIMAFRFGGSGSGWRSAGRYDYEDIVNGDFSKRVSGTLTLASGDFQTGTGFYNTRFQVNSVPEGYRIRIRESKLEVGNVATDWTPAPEDMATQAQLSVLHNAVDLAVEEGDVIGRLNIQAGHTLIQNGEILIDADTVRFTGSAFIPNAAIEEVSANKIIGNDGQFNTLRSRFLTSNLIEADHLNVTTAMIDRFFANSALIERLTSQQAFIDQLSASNLEIDGGRVHGTLNGNSLNFVNIDVNSLSGNQTEFVRSYWNNAVGGNVQVTGSGIVTTASDGSQSLVQNGVFLSRNNSGATVGYLGYSQLSGSPWYRLQTTLGANFEIRGLVSGGSNRQMMSFFPQSNEIYMHPSNLYMVGRINAQSGITSSGTLHMGGNTITQVSQINLQHGGYLTALSSNSELRLRASGGRMQIGTSGSWAIVIDNTHTYMHRTLNMQGHSITEQSDERLKSNIEKDTSSKLAFFKQIDLTTFEWADGREDYGVIAQQLHSIDPATVDTSTEYLSVNSSLIQKYSWRAIQELAYLEENTNKVASHAYLLAEQHEDDLACYKKKIEELEKKVKRLEGAA